MRLSLPAALGALVDMLQVLIDMIMVGHLDSNATEATAAVGISLQFTGLFYAAMGVLFVGSNALMSRFLGAGETKEAATVYSTFTIFSLALAVPLVPLFALCAHLPFVIMDTGEIVAQLGAEYLFIFAFALPALMFSQIAFSAFSAAADIRTPLMIKLSLCVVNVIISYYLIFIAGFGVAGAAAGTVIAEMLESAAFAFMIFAKHRPFKPPFVYHAQLLWRGLKVGFPAGVERLITFGSFLVYMRIVAYFGTIAMAGYQIGLRVEGVAFMPGIGFTIAAMALTGRHLGAKNPQEAEKDAFFTAFSAGVLMGTAGILMTIFAVPLAAIFTEEADAVEEAALYLRCMGLSQIPLGISFVISGAFRGAGDSRTSLKINMLSMWIFRILPAIFLTWYFHNILFVWLATLVETWLRAAWLVAVFKRGKWKTIKV